MSIETNLYIAEDASAQLQGFTFGMIFVTPFLS